MYKKKGTLKKKEVDVMSTAVILRQPDNVFVEEKEKVPADVPMQIDVLDCAIWLQQKVFESFTISKIFVRYNEKELIVIADKIDNFVLEEFYAKTFNFAYARDNEIVFIITDENSINYSEMPKYDKIIEVSSHE